MQITPDNQFATDAYLSAKAHWKGKSYKKRPTPTNRGSVGVQSHNSRDPKLLSFVLTHASQDFGWKREMEQAKIVSEWAEFIGETTAEHTKIVEISEGTITIQCDSTAWATELRRLRSEILTRIVQNYAKAHISELKFLSPGAPSWKHGPRSVPGRGPRDTYA